jgi:beta-lactamase regulating signal transducer with metallopeptidase domain
LELWAVWLNTIRDELMRLPPIPASVWLTGCGLIASVTVIRTLRAQRRLRHARPAPSEVVDLVHETACRLRLRRVPDVWITTTRISPMVSCGRRARMMLPAALWAQLDDVGRRAIVCHELAHLKRRDHWVCWLALIVGCVYWWHPVVWWARRRIREEADLCCDVWVTTLMPRARRAYATALLETKRFTALPPSPGPTVAIGAAALPAQRFRRRLIMVMSQQLKPRLTWGGIVLAGTLAAGSWFAAPSLACPPDEKNAPPAPPAVEPPAPPAPAPRASLFSKRSKHASKKVEKQLQSRLEGLDVLQNDEIPLEKRLATIEHKLDAALRLIEKRLAELDLDGPELERVIEQIRPLAHEAPRAIAEALEQPAVREYLVALGAMGNEHRLPVGAFAAAGAPKAPKDVYTKQYELPEGRLEALTELMSREDVPVLIRPGDDAITVIGPADQHMIFRAFTDLVTSDDDYREMYELPEGRLDALTEFMSRSDVPVLISPRDDGIVVHGNKLEHTIFAAFVEMITDDARMDEVRSYEERAERAPASQSQRARAHERRAQQQRVQAQALKAQRESMRHQAQRLLEQSKAIENEMKKLGAEAAKLEAKAAEIEAKAENADGKRRLELVRKANEIALQAQRIANRHRLLEAKLDAIDQSLDTVDEQVDQIEAQLEEIAEQIERQHEERGTR